MKIETAGLIVELNPKGDLLLSRVEPYKYVGEKPADIVIDVSEQYYLDRQKENPHLTFSECEYLWSAARFYELLARFSLAPRSLRCTSILYARFCSSTARISRRTERPCKFLMLY